MSSFRLSSLLSHPRLSRAVSWGISIGSLTLGLATLFIFRRGLPRVGWIVGYLLLVTVLLTVLAELRAPLERRGRGLVVSAGEYLLQTLCHGLFLFVLPAYYAAATLVSPNVVLPLFLVAAALITTIDPWYRTLVHPRPWLRCAVIALALFAGLNVALALLGLPSIGAAIAAAGLAPVALMPALRRPGRDPWRRAGGRAAVCAVTAMTAVWINPVWVPPAPMFIASAIAARDVVNLTPVDVIKETVDSATVAQWGSLVAYTAVYAPAGMTQSLQHVWTRDGVRIARIPLVTPVMGGRREGFRTFSRRRAGPPEPGRYRIDVVTTSGQLIGRLSFTVTS